MQPDSSPTLFKSAKAFETWLKKNHAASDGLWLKIAKRGANEPSVSYAEAVEIALCWGWIDGQKKGLDGQHFLQRFTPRRAQHLVEGQRRQGRGAHRGGSHAGAGLRADRGRQGRRALGAGLRRSTHVRGARGSVGGAGSRAGAKAFFATINAANRYAVLWRIQTAVKAETRAGASPSWWRCWPVAKPSTSSKAPCQGLKA